MNKIIKNNLLMIKYIAKFCPTQIILSILNAVLTSLISVLNILFLRYIINSITNNISFNKIIAIILTLMAINIVYCFLNIWLQQIIIPKNTETLHQKMQLELYEKLIMVDLECYENVEFYNKFTLAFQQADSRALAVLNSFSSLIGSLFGITALVSLISSFEPILLFFIVVNVGISFYINTKTIKIQYKFYEDKVPYERESTYSQRVLYQRDYAKEIRLFDRLPIILTSMFDSSVYNIIALVKLYGKQNSKFLRLQGIVNYAINSSISLYLAYKVLTKALNIADFVTLSNGSQQLSGQISQLINIFPQLYEHSMYIENFTYLINYTPKIANNSDGLNFPIEPLIEFEDVSFSYPNTKKIVLNKINIKISSGEKIAFVGQNGAGKSTLVKLITRLYDPSKGQLLLNEFKYQDYNVKSLRNNVGIVFQDYQIFAITIAENILMRPIINQADDEELINNALKFVGLYEKVNSLPNGIYTVLTREFENTGAIFSGGEFQKLVIARIYVKKCSIIILDEPSSSLDPIAESEIFNSLLKLTNGKTVILISHRLANVKNVDRIFFIENGLLLESGSHNDLMQLNGKYASMYKLQADKYDY